jgi:hypothetical protein
MAVAALRAGQRVTFGKLALDNNFLYSGGKTIRWQDIIRARIERGIVTIHTDKVLAGRIKVKAAEVPNVWIFNELLNTFALVEYGDDFR